jgi:hypothetical protein
MSEREIEASSVAEDGEAMTTKRVKKKPAPKSRILPEWPADKPIPDFASAEEEDALWGSYFFRGDGGGRGTRI